MSQHSSVSFSCVAAASALALAACVASADVLFDSGPFVTNPTGGTGQIAGQPISNADGFTVPGSTFIFTTTGIGATIPVNVSVAEDFTVPAGGWNLDAVTLFAFQTSQTTPTVRRVRINLWSAPPFSAGSPAPRPDPLPTPLLSEPLLLDAGLGTFVAHRQSATSTSTIRPVFAYTVSLDGLPRSGFLAQGTYWLEWSFEGASTPSQNVFIPLVSPRTAVSGHNARLFNALNSSDTRDWFEGREGFVAGQADGRPYTLPFILRGTIPCAADFNNDGQGDFFDYLDFAASFSAEDPSADINADGQVDFFDYLDFATAFDAGCN
ncbi:MAG: hypothetical protein SFZ23_12720 [Planctomycetota bacterium]|nr:hypothetical protein [Planctomycetota bacterium]